MSASRSVSASAPKVVNVTKVTASIRRPAILQFTPRQWKAAIAKARRSDTLDLASAQLVAVPTADGGAMVFQANVPAGAVPVLSFAKSHTTADGAERIYPGFESLGRPNRPIPKPPQPRIEGEGEGIEGDPKGGLPKGSPCQLAIRMTGAGSARLASLVCELSGLGGSCVMVWRRQENGTMLLGCQFRPLASR